MLNFIGVGSAFNTELGNNSAFIKKQNCLILVDCGGTVFHKLQELNMLDGLENLYIIITHTHPDHVGSLGDVIFYSYYILNKRPIIIFPDEKLIVNYLECMGVSSEMYTLESNNLVEVEDYDLGKINIEFYGTSHVATIPSYGFIMKYGEHAFYYSGDSNGLNKKIISKFENGEVQEIYQDTCGLDYEGNNHMSLRKLEETIDGALRKKVYCMHLDKDITKEQIEEKGFNVAEIYMLY